MSSTPEMGAGFMSGSPVRFIMEVNDGSSTGNFSLEWNALSEKEILINHGTEFDITSVRRDANGNVYIFLTEKAAPALTIDDIKLQLPPMKDASDAATYIQDLLSTTKTGDSIDLTVTKAAVALQTVIEGKAATDPTGAYYELLTFTGESIPTDIKTQILTEAINGSPTIRSIIDKVATDEITLTLQNRFGITDPEIIKKVKASLLGDSFVTDGIRADWDGYVETMADHFTKKLQQEIDAGKEAVIWSGIDDEYHHVMNEQFATIENATLGSDMYFIDMVYSNWKGEGMPKLKDLWFKLSEQYAKSVSQATSGSQPITQIKFLYPDSKAMDSCFGGLFKEAELPTICSLGKIETITMTKVVPGTMEILETVDIDIRDIVAYYQANDIGAGLSDVILTETVFEMFKKKVKEAMI